MFGRPRQQLLGVLVVLHVFGMLGGTHNGLVEAQLTGYMNAENTSEVFSPQWVEKFSRDQPGCALGRGLYTWRAAGFGSNINNLLHSWVYGLAVEGWSDVAVHLDSNQLQQLECSQESDGLASHGWSCLFSYMPHLCPFSKVKIWKQHLISAGLSANESRRGCQDLGIAGRDLERKTF